MTNTDHSIDWTTKEYDSFGLVAQVNKHRYHELPLFTDEALIELLDNYPRRYLQAFTMGVDPTANEDWKCVDIDANSSGAELWQAVNTGRIWLNVTHIERNSKDFAHLITGMYEHIGKHCPHLQNPTASFSTLLISSPNAQVYYHLDAEPNMLWHLRGEKKIWVYPAMDTRFVPQHLLEAVIAGEIDENLPYDLSYDELAQEYLLKPGDVASWPHNGPHRIVNQNLNVSLATSYQTPSVYRREYTQLANRFVMRSLGIENPSMDENGLVPALKRLAYRVANKVRPFKRKNRSAGYVTDLQVDHQSPLSLRKLPEARPASFSSARAQSV